MTSNNAGNLSEHCEARIEVKRVRKSRHRPALAGDESRTATCPRRKLDAKPSIAPCGCGPGDNRLRVRVAVEMLQSFEWERALESCDRVLVQDPDHVGALEVKAQAQWYGGRYELVVQTTTKLLRLNPYEPGYRYTRGMANLSLGKVQEALHDFRSAEQQSNNPAFKAQVLEAIEATRAWIGDHSPSDSGWAPSPRTGHDGVRAARLH